MQTQFAAPQVAPQPGESEEDYIVRAHYALHQTIPDPGKRNQVIWDSWDATNGNPMFDQAARYFGADQYSNTPPRPFFMEHEKVNYGPDGSEQITNYDLGELTKIVRENNHRIQDTDAYTALVDKHTLPPPYRDPDPPKNLGFVGPYRLGMLGKKNPRWAIFANEWQRNDKAEQLRDRPNRSVEVLQLKANGRRYIDPIAALSEAPRLPLPTTAQYSATADGQEAMTVERYDATPAIYAAYPGGMNTHITGTKNKKAKDMYDGSDTPNQDLIREVLNALMSTEEWQSITNAAAAIGDDQPMTSGQDVLANEPMADPMAGDMPEPPMEDPMMDGMPPAMDGEMPVAGDDEEEYIQADEELMPEQNMGKYGHGAGKYGMGKYGVLGTAAAVGAGTAAGGAMGANKVAKAAEDGVKVDRNNPAALAAAGRVAAGAGGRAAAGAGGRAAAGSAGRQTAGQTAKGMGQDVAMDMAVQKMMGGGQGGGGGQEQPKKKGILARILEGPTPDDIAEAPQTFGATKGYHRYDSFSEGNMKRDQYAALTAENAEMRKELSELKKHNDNLLTEQAQMYAATQHEVVQLRQNAIDAERKERLTHLAHQYSAVNLSQEMDECLYANGSEMTNDEFDKRCDLIGQYCAASAAKSPMIPLGYDGSLANGDVQNDRFAAQVADRALELVNQGIKSGSRLNYQEAVAKAKEELSK